MSVYSQITANKTKTYLIMGLFVAFITFLAFVFGQSSGYGLSWAGLALILSGILSLSSFYFSDSMVLAISGAKPITESDNPELFHSVENLSMAAGLPMPKIYLASDPTPNAFATGRDPEHAVICVNSGLLAKLTKTELEGVIAHELSHVKDYDTRLAAVVVVLVGLVAVLSDWFLRSFGFWGKDEENNKAGAVFLIISFILALVSPIIATLIQLAVSRKRELLADANGAFLTRYPEGLARALEKIAADRSAPRTATNATAHLYIVNPFAGKDLKTWFSGLFDTHPPVEERIKILRAM